jgi:hypothetical protein
MSSVNLYRSNNRYIYRINDVLYDARTLEAMNIIIAFPSNEITVDTRANEGYMERSILIFHLDDIVNSLTSEPIIFVTNNSTENFSFAVATITNDHVRILLTSDPAIISQPISHVDGPFKVPNIAISNPRNLGIPLSQFNFLSPVLIVRELRDAINYNITVTIEQINGMTISELIRLLNIRTLLEPETSSEFNYWRLGQITSVGESSPITNSTMNAIPEHIEIDNLNYQVLYTLIARLYGLNVELPEYLILNGLKINFIPFDQLQNVQIERYTIDPLLQVFGGLPGTEYRVITIFGKNGRTYLVKAKYNEQTGKIYP